MDSQSQNSMQGDPSALPMRTVKGLPCPACGEHPAKPVSVQNGFDNYVSHASPTGPVPVDRRFDNHDAALVRRPRKQRHGAGGGE